MTLEHFTNLVRAMRIMQKEYFRRRNQGLLDSCKERERKVDKALDEMTKGPTLFDQPEQTP